MAWRELSHVAISHYHSDHVGDLSALLFALKHGLRPRRSEPLTLMGPPGFADFLDRLGLALGDHVVDPGFALRVVELAPGEPLEGPGFALSAAPTPHSEESVAFRLEGPWGRLGYTGDTGPSEAVASFLAGCDALLSECALTDPPEMRFHLSPRGVAELAKASDPGLLVITHVYPPLTPDQAAREVSAAGFDGPVVPAADGLRVSIEDGSVTVAPPGTSV